MPAKRPDAPENVRVTPSGDVHAEAPPALPPAVPTSSPAVPLDAAPVRAEGDAPAPAAAPAAPDDDDAGEGEGPERKPIETWATELGTPAFLFEGAKARKGWGIGQMVTKSQFDAAMRAFGRVELS